MKTKFNYRIKKDIQINIGHTICPPYIPYNLEACTIRFIPYTYIYLSKAKMNIEQEQTKQ